MFLGYDRCDEAGFLRAFHLAGVLPSDLLPCAGMEGCGGEIVQGQSLR